MEFTINNFHFQINHNLGNFSTKRLEIIRDTFKVQYPIEGNANALGAPGIAFTDGKSHVLISGENIVFVAIENEPDWEFWAKSLRGLLEKLAFDITGYAIRLSGIINSEDSFKKSLSWINNSSILKEKIPQLGGVGLRLFLPVEHTNDIAELKIEPLLEDRNATFVEFIKGSTSINKLDDIIDSSIQDLAAIKGPYLESVLAYLQTPMPQFEG